MLKTTLGSCVFGLFLLVFGIATVQAATTWYPTDSGEIDINYLYVGAPSYVFAIFDDQSSLVDSDPHLILNYTPIPNTTIAGDTINFKQNGNDWDLTSTKTGNTMTLSDSYNFKVALQGPNNTWIGNTDFYKVSYGQYVLLWPQDISLQQVDAKPVPVPSSLLLLGSGLLGLIGLKGKRSQ